ncbi:hypothetical protein BS78_08G017800 [Paspalum vaginatum]|nr:hypothetical protein BS78_08G017800 [Paspalum vaginatum]
MLHATHYYCRLIGTSCIILEDALKKRVRAFAEGAMVMACPVLLAVALQKVNLKSAGNGGFLPGSISPLAALTLEAGLLPFLCLSLPCRLLVAQDLLFRASKALVHLCALLLMALACGILLLISTKNLYYIAVLPPLVLLTLWRCFLSMRSGRDHDDAVYRGCDEMLERSLDFSASVTSLLFLGLEGLALEGQSSSSGQPLLGVSLGAAFVACALGVFAMLLGTVPPLVTDDAGGRKMCNVVEALNVVLAVATAVIVLLITSVPLGEAAWLLFVPLLLSFVVWMYTALAVDDGHQLAGHGAAVGEGEEGEGFWRPASMELTKVTFTGFLAVSVPTYSDSSISSYTHGFILLTAAAVVSGLGWRLLTHRMAPSRALVTAANVSSFCAHLCVAAAVVPFTTMAVNALK